MKANGATAGKEHFVVLLGVFDEGAAIVDPPHSLTVHPTTEFFAEWTGVVMSFPEGTDQAAQVRSLYGGRANAVELAARASFDFATAATMIFAWKLGLVAGGRRFSKQPTNS